MKLEQNHFMIKHFIPCLLLFFLMACNQQPNGSNSSTTDTIRVASTDTASSDPLSIAMSGELPAQQSIPVLFDEMDYQQATQSYLWALPLVTFAEWQWIHENVFGAKTGDLVVYNSYEDRLGILTANATTPYIMGFMDLAKTGPLVIEMPAGHTAGGSEIFGSGNRRSSVSLVQTRAKAENMFLYHQL